MKLQLLEDFINLSPSSSLSFSPATKIDIRWNSEMRFEILFIMMNLPKNPNVESLLLIPCPQSRFSEEDFRFVAQEAEIYKNKK